MNPVNTVTHVVLSLPLFNSETDSAANEDQDEWGNTFIPNCISSV
jgi:hypothetical protein